MKKSKTLTLSLVFCAALPALGFASDCQKLQQLSSYLELTKEQEAKFIEMYTPDGKAPTCENVDLESSPW